MIVLITYNERMEKPVRLRKTGPIACKSIPKVESIADFCSHNDSSDSGVELRGLGRPTGPFSSSNPLHCVNCLVEQPFPDDIQQREVRRTVGWGKEQREGERGRERVELHRLLKTREMVKMFWEKASWNSLLRKPVSYSPFQDLFAEEGSWLMDKLSLRLSGNAVSLLYLLKLICVAIYCFLFPLSLLYHQVAAAPTLFILKWACLFFSLYDLLETLQKRCEADSNLNQEKALAFRRRKKMSLAFQLSALVLGVLSVGLCSVGVQLGDVLFVGPWVGLWHLVEQVHRLEDRFINASQLLKYWRLFRVIVKNLFVCHLLACALIVVAQLHEGNWMTASGIGQLPWQEQYIWSYYFGTTIILTIGFGDLHASNSTQAFLIIVISFFSCVFFGYNINYIGNLINSIKQEENQRNAKLKLLNSLAKKAKVSPEVHQEIARYIIEESKIKQKSDYGEEKRLLKELPESLRSSFLQEANQKLFNHLRLLIPLGNQAIERLSLKIEARFCHPDQLIKGQDSPPSLVILQSGEVGYATRSRYPSRLRNVIIERISSKLESESRIVCLDLIGQSLNYDIKSLDYSIIYEMERATFQETIMESKKDYHCYRELLDRCRFKLNEFGLVRCRFCENHMHTLFECPRVHYQPFRKTLPLKYNQSKLNLKQSRVKFQRDKMQVSCEVIVQSKNSRELEAELSDSMSMISIEKDNLIRGKRNSSHLNRVKNNCLRPSNQNMLITIQMVTQLRDDIKNLKRPSIAHFQFSLWDNVDCDEASNFQFYFTKWNPDTLGQKSIKNTLLSKTNRIKRKIKNAYST